jgi:hypothetical protein
MEAQEITALGNGHLNLAIIRPQCRPPQPGDPLRLFAPSIKSGPSPIANRPVDELRKKIIHQNVWGWRLPGVWHLGFGIQRSAHRWHSLSKRSQASPILRVIEHR